MNLKKSSEIEFTSSMTRFQTIATLIWLVLHASVLGVLFVRLPLTASLTDAEQNLLYYALSTVVLLVIDFTFLRRDFDTLLDNFGHTILEILRTYALVFAIDLILSLILSLVLGEEALELDNVNNDAVVSMASRQLGMVKAAGIFLAPIAEELMFRGALFGSIRKKNRILAYAVSMLVFSIYHVWGYAIENPVYWLYGLQYLIPAYALCRCYERSNTIWGSIFFHMTWNALTFQLLM